MRRVKTFRRATSDKRFISRINERRRHQLAKSPTNHELMAPIFITTTITSTEIEITTTITLTILILKRPPPEVKSHMDFLCHVDLPCPCLGGVYPTFGVRDTPAITLFSFFSRSKWPLVKIEVTPITRLLKSGKADCQAGWRDGGWAG